MHKGIFDITMDEVEVKLIPATRLSHLINLGVDERRRTIYLDGEIEEDTGSWFNQIVQHMGAEQIQLHINTPGGDETSMFAIYDVIQKHGNVKAYGFGQVCSAGVLILVGCQTRTVAPSTILMSHESHGSSGELGYQAAKDRRKVDDFYHSYWATLMAKHTPNDEKWWRMKTEKTAEYWLLGGEKIVEAGLADSVA
jgi:ATP-dependent protease ClpP protease subunit